ncbi:MAG: Protein HemY [Candidatus Celerinatantimonas neptuna]|nr:MAG: Protein HemY [Candidatus Celerinatantimonas neptuna]
MIKLFLLLLVVAIGMIAGPLLEGHQGYVLIALGHYTIEMSVIGLITGLIVVFIIAQILVSLLRQLFLSIPRLRNVLSNRRIESARQQTQQGLLAMYQGDYQDAQLCLAKSARGSESPSLNYLSAAKAAAQQGNLQQSDKLLDKADHRSNNPQTQQAIQLARAQLKLESGDLVAATQLLEQLPAAQLQRPSALKLRFELSKAQQDWDNQLEILIQLAKQNPSNWQPELEQAYTGKFKALAKEGVMPFKTYWKNLPRKLKQQTWLLKSVAPALSFLKETELLIRLLKKPLKLGDPIAIELASRLPKDQAVKLLPLLENIHQQNQKNAPVLTALGAICLIDGQIEKAQQYLEKSIEIRPSKRAYILLGELFAVLRNHEQAIHWYRQATEKQPD